MERLTEIFKLLSDETRLRVVMLLAREETCVCEIVGVLGIPQPKVSKALSKLRDLGLVNDERKEKYVYYSIKPESKVLLGIAKDILENIGDYPQLELDGKNLKYKERYSNSCCVVSDEEMIS
ncbi:ArsR/SmtB family transcription factor [Youngiibacter fragilis]|uniref:Transcriptional regulator n=1 Tax=Youngiibacter fragilis 232.1 TaxID=994573 RepID=V7I4L3_9CLOT|nr:metalloregulator ArsR/SmtB family transcription factor [Youngiibacter fragilis]ETA79937.1 transcriptional regulator [Youngiibacter fragilis 232.1]